MAVITESSVIKDVMLGDDSKVELE